jgi:hypothetical protein
MIKIVLEFCFEVDKISKILIRPILTPKYERQGECDSAVWATPRRLNDVKLEGRNTALWGKPPGLMIPGLIPGVMTQDR